MMDYCFHTILRNADYNILVEGVFLNYLNLKYCQNNFYDIV